MQWAFAFRLLIELAVSSVASFEAITGLTTGGRRILGSYGVPTGRLLLEHMRCTPMCSLAVYPVMFSPLCRLPRHYDAYWSFAGLKDGA